MEREVELMSLGFTLALSLLVLTAFGTIQPVLERSKLSRRQALGVETALLLGTLVPMVTIGKVRLEPGPVCAGIAVGTLLLRGQGRGAAAWALLAAFIAGMAVFSQRMLVPGAEEQLPMATWVFEGILGGAAAGILCRNVRCAMTASLVGVLAADVAHGAAVYSAGAEQLLIGHTELMDEAMLALLTAFAVSWAVTLLMEGARLLWQRVRAQPGS